MEKADSWGHMMDYHMLKGLSAFLDQLGSVHIAFSARYLMSIP